jgi:hypothetical protein
MNVSNLTDLHYAYVDFPRHWHVGSEAFTGGDALYTAIREGWEVSHEVGFEERWKSGARGTPIYYFELTRSGETVIMPVIGNPYVRRVIRTLQAALVSVEAQTELNRKRAKNAEKI